MIDVRTLFLIANLVVMVLNLCLAWQGGFVGIIPRAQRTVAHLAIAVYAGMAMMCLMQHAPGGGQP